MKKVISAILIASAVSAVSLPAHAGLVDNMTALTFDTSSFFSNKRTSGQNNCFASNQSLTSFTISGGGTTYYCSGGYVLFNETVAFDMLDNFVLDFSFTNTSIYSGGPSIYSGFGGLFSRTGSWSNLQTRFLGTTLSTSFNTRNGGYRILKEENVATLTHLSSGATVSLDVSDNRNVYELSRFSYSGSYSDATLSNVSYATQAWDANAPALLGALSLVGFAALRRKRSEKSI